MPTHKDLPDNYLDSRRRRGPAGWSNGTWVAIIIAVGLAVGVAGALLLHHTSAASAGAPPKVDAGPVHGHRRRQRHKTTHKVKPASRPENKVKVTVVAPAPKPKPPSSKPRLLAVGVSLPGHGRAPRLIVTGDHNHITVRSRSPLPLVITSDSHRGQRMRAWKVLDRGQTTTRVLLTGRWYGYCFNQAAGAGYAATRACFATRWYELLNGTRLPDGAPITTYLRFLPG